MKYIAKTIRFSKSPKSQVALRALDNFSDYGFSSANEMVMTALYELAERHNNPNPTDFPIDSLADMIAERLKGKLNIVADTASIPTASALSEPATLDAPENVSDDDMRDIMADILSF